MKLNSVLERAMLLGAYPILALTLTGYLALAGVVVVALAAVLAYAVRSALKNLLPGQITWLSIVAVCGAGGMAGALLLPYILPIEQGTSVPLAIAAITPIAFVMCCRREDNNEAAVTPNFAVLVGFAAMMVITGSVRELLAEGTLFGFILTPNGAIPAGIMGTPVGGFLFLGTVFVLLRVTDRKLSSRGASASGAQEGVLQ